MITQDVILQDFVSRPFSLATQISRRVSGVGLASFFLEKIPFCSVTSKYNAAKIVELIIFFAAQNKKKKTYHVYEFGVGLGVLANHILDILAEHHPSVYQKINYHVSDVSKTQLKDLQSSSIFQHHQDKVSYTCVDLCDPVFAKNAQPMLVFHTYLLDALPARHIKVVNGDIFEILVQTRISADLRILDSSVFPPLYMDATTIKDICENPAALKSSEQVLFDRRLIGYLIEEYKEVSLQNSSMTEEEKNNLSLFIKNTGMDNCYFNYSQDIVESTLNIFQQLPLESCYFMIDYHNNKLLTADLSHKQAMRSLLCSCNRLKYYQVEPRVLEDISGSCVQSRNQKNSSFFNSVKYFDQKHHVYAYCVTNNIASYTYIFDKIFGYQDSVQPQKLLSKLYYSESVKDVLKHFNSLHAFHQEMYSTLIDFSVFCYDHKYLVEAREFALKSLKVSAGISLRSLLLLGDICFIQQQFDEAENYFLKIHQLCPYYVSVYSRLISLYKQLKKSDELIYFLKEWIVYTDSTNISYPILELLKVSQTQDLELNKKVLEWIQEVDFEVVQEN